MFNVLKNRRYNNEHNGNEFDGTAKGSRGSGCPKAAYLNLTAWVLKNPKYDETHLIKLSLPKEVREKMSDEQKKAMPIIGGMKPVVMDSNTINESNIPFVQSGDTDDLPF